MLKVYAVADVVPEKSDCFTVGKEYEIVADWKDGLFSIIDDSGDLDNPRTCAWENCYHLNGGSWRRVEREE